MKKIKTNNPDETIELGRKIGELFKNEHVVILLKGDLAAGKTTLTKGIALGLNINEVIKSPTFTIMKQYISKDMQYKLIHLDLYRLNNTGFDFDLEEYIDDEECVVVIEWPFQARELIPDAHILVEIEGTYDEREFLFSSNNAHFNEVINKI